MVCRRAAGEGPPAAERTSGTGAPAAGHLRLVRASSEGRASGSRSASSTAAGADSGLPTTDEGDLAMQRIREWRTAYVDMIETLPYPLFREPRG